MKSILEYVVKNKLRNPYDISDNDIKSFTYDNPITCNGILIKFTKEQIQTRYEKLSDKYKQKLFYDFSNFLSQYEVSANVVFNMYIPRVGENNECVFFGVSSKNDTTMAGTIDYDLETGKFTYEDTITNKVYSGKELKKIFDKL